MKSLCRLFICEFALRSYETAETAHKQSFHKITKLEYRVAHNMTQCTYENVYLLWS